MARKKLLVGRRWVVVVVVVVQSTGEVKQTKGQSAEGMSLTLLGWPMRRGGTCPLSKLTIATPRRRDRDGAAGRVGETATSRRGSLLNRSQRGINISWSALPKRRAGPVTTLPRLPVMEVMGVGVHDDGVRSHALPAEPRSPRASPAHGVASLSPL